MSFLNRFKRSKPKPVKRKPSIRKKPTLSSKIDHSAIKQEGDLSRIEYKLDTLINLLQQHDSSMRYHIQSGVRMTPKNVELKIKVLQEWTAGIPKSELLNRYSGQVSKATIYRWLKE